LAYTCGGLELVPKYTSYPVAPDDATHCSATDVCVEGYDVPLLGELKLNAPGTLHDACTENDQVPLESAVVPQLFLATILQ
jgi:hypothetical protein